MLYGATQSESSLKRPRVDITAIAQFGQTKCSYQLQDAGTSAALEQKHQVNEPSVSWRGAWPGEEDFWQAVAAGPAKAGTRPVARGQAPGCQVWDTILLLLLFFKILSLLLKRYSILPFFFFFLLS